MLNPDKDLEYMKLAFEESKKCQSENDGRVHPHVGAVILTQSGHLISTGYRGQSRKPGQSHKGDHAEQVALHGQLADILRGAVVYTTLEPCTVRGKEPSCCQRLITAGVSEVVIGMLDPNRDIRGRGWWELEENRIRVRCFDPDIVQQIRQLNSDFIEYQLGVGLLIIAIQSENETEIRVEQEHRDGLKVLTVPQGHMTIRGTYRVKPTSGDRIVMLVRRDNRYFQQAPINFDLDRTNRIWVAPSAWVGTRHDNELFIPHMSDDSASPSGSRPRRAENELVIARVSDDLIDPIIGRRLFVDGVV
jgi:pyrimidine deaminase RibD-like protein